MDVSESPLRPPYGATPRRTDVAPRLHPLRLVVSLLVSSLAVFVAAAVLPGLEVGGLWGAVVAAALIGVLNATLAPLVAAIHLPFTVATSFLLGLVLDAVVLLAADAATADALVVEGFGWALVAAFVISAVSTVLHVIAGTNDDDAYTIRVVQRVARRSGERLATDVPGLVFLEIDGLALPVLQRAMRDGSAPTLARWLAEGTHRLLEWETDLSAQTGASQAGILFGSNADIPAFRWVEKQTGRVVSCSSPRDCAEIERRLVGDGLLAGGGASLGNLLSGEAEHVILTVSRLDAEKGPNPGYRSFFANGFNVTRVLVLFTWEVILEWVAALRAIRRDVHPRGRRGGVYPFIRATLCVVVRDLIVYGVLTDMMKGCPAIYATFSSYDEVAHHSGLERADTLEALRKVDQHLARIDRARRYAPRPYEIVVLSDHGQTQGATFEQRNGYGLDELVAASLTSGAVSEVSGGDEQAAMVGHAVNEAIGRTARDQRVDRAADRQVVVLGSGNLGLVYLLEERRRLSLEEIEERHPRLLPALREHPDIGWVLVRSSTHGPVALGARGAHYLAQGRVEGDDPLAPFSPNAPAHLLRSDGFANVADLLVGSSYDPALDEGHAFEELISFHGGLGGPQTRAFVLYPAWLPVPDEPLVGAVSVHGVLAGWRRLLQGEQRDDVTATPGPRRA
jgi:uncharacterized membrane protein YvlD (DUF360 family)